MKDDSKAFISYLNQYNYNIKMIGEYIKKSEELLRKIEEYIATLPDGKEKDELLSEIKRPAICWEEKNISLLKQAKELKNSKYL